MGVTYIKGKAAKAWLAALNTAILHLYKWFATDWALRQPGIAEQQRKEEIGGKENLLQSSDPFTAGSRIRSPG